MADGGEEVATMAAAHGPVVDPAPGSSDPLEPEAAMHDTEAMAEIELYGELVIAASASDSPLTQAQIDAALGLGPEEPYQR